MQKYIVFIFLFFFCIPPSNYKCCDCTSEILYQLKSFSPKMLTNSGVLILPVLVGEESGTLKYLDIKEITKMLLNVRKDLTPIDKKDFELRIKAKYDSTILISFYKNLYNSDIIALQNSDSIWQETECDYCLVMRIKNAVKIKSINNVIKRKMILETELWKINRPETVLRIETICSSLDKNILDSDFLLKAISLSLEKIPSYFPGNNEQRW